MHCLRDTQKLGSSKEKVLNLSLIRIDFRQNGA